MIKAILNWFNDFFHYEPPTYQKKKVMLMECSGCGQIYDWNNGKGCPDCPW